MAVVFMVIGGIGLLVLVLAVILGDVIDIGNHFELGGDAFSTAALAGFAAAFGFGAAIVDAFTHQTWLALVAGAVAGAAVAWLVVRLTQALRTSGTDSTVKTSGLVGLEGTVLSAIPDGGFGQIRVRAHGHQLTFNARSDRALAQGERVWISGVVSPTAVEVRDSDPLAGPPDVDALSS